MVAEAEKPSVSSKRSPRVVHGYGIPLSTRIKAKNLYVGQHAQASVVSAATGLSVKQVYWLADREGWTKLRAETKRKIAENVNARAQADIDELVEEVANETAELSLGTLAKAKKTLERDDEFAAKDLQAYSVAAKNFVGLYRQAKQLDAAQSSEGSTTTNVFFLSALPPAPRISKDVTPAPAAIELPAPAAVEQPVSESTKG